MFPNIIQEERSHSLKSPHLLAFNYSCLNTTMEICINIEQRYEILCNFILRVEPVLWSYEIPCNFHNLSPIVNNQVFPHV